MKPQRSLNFVWLFSVALVPLLGLATTVPAQVTTARISGVVQDETTALVPGVTVTLTNTNTSASRTVVTDGQGRYEAPNLPLGIYEVRAELQGFRSVVRRGIELTLGRNAVIDFSLGLGEFTEDVIVTGEAALIEHSTPTVSSLIDEVTVKNLPLNNRDLTQLTYLQPGIVRTRARGSSQGGFGTKITAGGARVDANLYLVDGVVGGESSGSIQGASGAYTGAETIKEFQVIVNNYSAEYRSTPGAIVSAVTKSGTNQLDGSVFWFHRNDSLDAPNFFDSALGSGKPDFQRNQFGFSVGGPILRDRTFFFGSYEGLRESLARTAVARVPTLAAREGHLPGGVVAVAPEVRPYLDLWPAPNGRDYGDGTADYVAVDKSPSDGHFGAIKIDHFFGGEGNDQLVGSYTQDVAEHTLFGVLPDTNAIVFDSHRQILSLRHQRILGHGTLHELQFGYARSTPRDNIPIPQRDLSGLEFRPVRSGIMGSIGISQIATIGHGRGTRDWSTRNLQIRESITVTRGRHSMRMGAEMNRLHNDVISENQGYFGSYTFDSWREFLQGRPAEYLANLEVDPNLQRNMRQSIFGFYFQDDYAVRPSLTVNLGLRYEFATRLTETKGRTSALIEPFVDTEFTVGPLAKDNPTLWSFGPRLGFAWDPTGSGQSSLRAGFGLFFKHPGYYEYLTTLTALPPFINIGEMVVAQVGPIVFPDAFQRQHDLLSSAPQARTVEWDPKQTYSTRWSLTFDRELPARWVMSVGYTGSRGYNLWRQTDTNLGQWQILPDGRRYFPSPNERPNPYWSNMRLTYADADSFYHGLTAGLRKRLSDGLQLQASYSFSKAIDEASDHTSGGAGFQAQRNIYGGVDKRLNRGLSAFDVRQQFALNLSYELPFGEGLDAAWAAALVKGWQVNAILLLADGTPLSVTGGDRTGQRSYLIETGGLRPDLVAGGDSSPVLGGWEQYFDPSQFAPSALGFLGNLGRQTLIGPGTATVDFSVTKNVPVRGDRHFQLRAEVFNLFNRVSLGDPNTAIFDSRGRPSPTAGRITSTSTTPRQIQIGVKFLF